MPLVPAKCTQCGANLTIDDSFETGVCQFCNTTFVSEKVINYNHTYITNNNNYEGATINIASGDINNFLIMASNALKTKNGKEALLYANKVLELDFTNYQAWIIKMGSLVYDEDSLRPRIDELKTCGENAIKYSPLEQRTATSITVYTYYLTRVYGILKTIYTCINDTIELYQLKTKISASKLQKYDIKNIDLYERTISTLINLKLYIPNTFITNNEQAQSIVTNIAHLYVNYNKSLDKRLSIYKCERNNDDINRANINLNNMK